MAYAGPITCGCDSRQPGGCKRFVQAMERQKKGIIDFDNITQKTKRASEMLTNVQSIMEMMSDYSKKQSER